MKFYLTIIFLLITPFLFAQQNLVTNPSFENIYYCPDNNGELNHSMGWIEINTADLFDTCATPMSEVGIPNNTMGHQFPLSGHAYAGFISYTVGAPTYREYVCQKLPVSLTIGQKYYVSFNVCLGEYAGCASNKLGILFTNRTLSDSEYWPANPFMNNFAHFYINNIITDSLQWTKINGSFIADSAYQYFLIGNFFDDNNTDTIHDNYFNTSYDKVAYYFLDDIYVGIDSLTNIEPYKTESVIKIFPNPATNELTVDYALTNKCNFELYNMLGAKRKVVALDCASQTKEIDLTDIDSGLYFYSVVDRNGNRIKTGKLIVIK
jgi:hypothetical protein